MKFVKILLIIVLLLVVCFAFSYGTGTIESGDKTYYFEPEEPTTLNEWFYKLPLREKIDVYTYWTSRVYSQDIEEVKDE